MPKLLRYAFLAIALIAAVLWMKHENDVDACNEAGGNWDNATKACVPVAPAAGAAAV